MLVNERLINCPPKLAPPLMQFLLEEIRAATTDAKLPKQQREAFSFKRYLIVTRVYADNEPGAVAARGSAREAAGPSSGKKQKVWTIGTLVTCSLSELFMSKLALGCAPNNVRSLLSPLQVAPRASGSGPVLVFLRPEDEFLHQHCSWSFTFPVEGRVVGKDDLQPLRMVMVVEAGRLPEVRRALDATVGNMAAEGGR